MVVTLSRARARGNDAIGLRQGICVLERGGDGGPRGGDELSRNVALRKRKAVGGNDVGDSRNWNGKHAVSGAYAAVSLAEGRDDDVVNAEVIDAEGGGNYVDDGVNSADLVEMHLLERHAMGLCLGFGNDIKDSVRDFTRAVAEGAGVDDGLYLGGAAMFVVVVVGVVMFVIVMEVMIMLMMVVMVVLVMMVMIMLMMMVVMLMIVMMVVMVMLVLMLVTIEVAVEPLHVVVVPIVLGIKHHIKVAGVERRDALATHLNLKTAHSKAAQRLA